MRGPPGGARVPHGFLSGERCFDCPSTVRRLAHAADHVRRANLIQASITGICLAAMLFKAMGATPGVAFQ
jgi:hypothetical protein